MNSTIRALPQDPIEAQDRPLLVKQLSNQTELTLSGMISFNSIL